MHVLFCYRFCYMKGRQWHTGSHVVTESVFVCCAFQASLATEMKSAAARMASKWHALQHMVGREQHLIAEQQQEAAAEAAAVAATTAAASAAGPSSSTTATAAAAAAAAGPSGSGAPSVDAATGGVSLGDEGSRTCPICLDEPSQWSVTSCGHTFCTDCIHELVVAGGVPCPICRHKLKRSDVFDMASEAEAAQDQLMQQAQGEYGAKVIRGGCLSTVRIWLNSQSGR